MSETEEAAQDDLPIIRVRKGFLPLILEQAEEALIAKGVPIYQRGLMLFHPVRSDRDPDIDGLNEDGKDSDGRISLKVRRKEGTLVLRKISTPWLRLKMMESAHWMAHGKGGDGQGWYPSDYPDVGMVNTLIEKVDWKFPVLKGITSAPLLDFDGRVVAEPGYDKGTQMLLEFGGVTYPPVPEAPSHEDARAALERLSRPFRAMPWVGCEGDSTRPNANRSVALSGLLTVMVRPVLRAAPLHMFDAPVPASGKSMIADCIGILKTGTNPAAMSQGPDDEEDEKRLSTVLATGDPVILLDNCTRPLTGDFLCSVLTQEVVQARILGLSERRLLPSTALLLATGNNMITAGDTFRRVVLCTLNPGVEHPEERHFDWDPRDEFRAARTQMVVDALTCLKAYRVAGSPLRGSLRPMGSFEDWAWIRETLVWLGEIDPAETRQEILSNDTASQELEQIMSVWETEFGDRDVSVSDIRAESRLGILLLDAISRREWSAKSVGHYLKRHKARIKNGKQFMCHKDNKANMLKWRLEGAQVKMNLRPVAQPADEEARSAEI
jgi:hypothetical protein